MARALFCSMLPLACFTLRKSRERAEAESSEEVALFCSRHGYYKSVFDLTCVCDPGWTSHDCSEPAAAPQSVGEECYSPGGSNGVATCDWYFNCLSPRYPGCKDHALEYAESYGGKYCRRFTDNSDQFSEDGRVWIDSVKLCLQEELVTDVLSLDVDVADCEGIRRVAFDSHPSCYLEPVPSNTSIGMCSLLLRSPLDVAKILEITLDALFSMESVRQMIGVAAGCAVRTLQSIVRPRLDSDGYGDIADLIEEGTPECPSDTSTGPDRDGDCKCNTGLTCFEAGSSSGWCTYSRSERNNGTSKEWFLPSCTDCKCLANQVY